MRRGLLPVVVVAVVCSPSVQAVARGWPQSRANARNDGAVIIEASASPAPRTWTFEGSGRAWGYTPGMSVWSSPSVAMVGDRAILAIGSYDHNVYVLDAATGELQWKMTAGDGVYAPPTLWHDGDQVWLFAASSDRLVYALDAATGRRRWIYSVAEFRPTLGGARLSSAVVGRSAAQDAVFFGHWVWDRSLTHSLQDGGVTALDARNGRRLWTTRLGDNQVTAPVFAEFDNGRRLFVGSSNGNTVALDADDGSVLWQRTELDAVRGTPAFVTTPIGPRVLTASKSGLVRCLDGRDGSDIWTYRTGDWITGAPVVAVLHARGLVIVGSYDRSVYALDLLSGDLVWRYHARGGIYAGVATVDAGGRSQVLASAWDHTLHAITARDGSPMWTAYTGRPLWDTVGLEHGNWAAPTVARINGKWMAYVGSYDGTLYALPIAEQMAGVGFGERSNRGFWISFPVALSLIVALAMLLTHRRRRRAAASADAE